MNMIKVIPNDPKVYQVHYTPKYAAICSIGGAPFHGVIEIVYRPKKLLLEYESVEAWVETLKDHQLTVEAVTRIVYDNLFAVIGNDADFIQVTVKARTLSHGDVECSIYSQVDFFTGDRK